MKSHRLQAMLARRREADFERTEKTKAVDKYFDHWTKVTTRFEAWTDAEYYKQADEALQKDKEKKLKEQSLKVRRAKLKQLLDNEEVKYQKELEELNRPKPRKLPNDLLEKLNRDQKYTAEEKRRLELESKLYGKWRYGINDENIIFESKSDCETLAKLNWLDKQIENRMLLEEEERQSQERKLKLLEETRKREENLKEQQIIREAEIKELRVMQESNLTELKTRELQSNNLRAEENALLHELEKIEKELTKLTHRKALKLEMNAPNNIKRVKMFFRRQSEQYRQDLKEDINVLNRILADHQFDEDSKRLKEQFENDLEGETKRQTTVDAMYESEVKDTLLNYQEEWTKQFKNRELQLTQVLGKIQKKLKGLLVKNMEEQKKANDLRLTLVASIENSNGKLTTIVKEQENYIQANDLNDPCSAEVGQRPVSAAGSNSNAGGDDFSPRRPQFGRKKVAWT